jgi:aspartate racemase
MHTQSFAEYVACIERDDWAGVGELMLASARKLAAAGAAFLICPDNTVHRALPLIESAAAALAAHRGGRRGAGRRTRIWTRRSLGDPLAARERRLSEKLAARGLSLPPSATNATR